MKKISANINFVAPFEKEVLTLQDQNTSNILPFNHEKAGVSVFLYVCNIVLTSVTPHVFIKTVDTDVFIIAIALLLHLELEDIWIGSGNGLHRINILIPAVYQQLGHDRSTGLLFSYAFTEVTKY